jgi:L-ascorbate metabolism protein UlaG (beta-lactamase superfamily)
MLENVHWLGHACFKFTGSKAVYIDPYQIEGGETADVILITHDHYDHLSMEDIEKVRGSKTVIVVPESASGSIKGNVKTMKAGDRIEVEGIEIQAVPAYNIGKKFHPKEESHVGYVFRVDDVTYYHSGDSDLIPEMSDIKTDVAFLPVGGTYTMNAEEAARAAAAIGPKVAVPMHWGAIVGSREDAEKFEKLCDCDVRILKQEE